MQQDMGYREEMKAFLNAAAGGEMPFTLEEILASSLATLRVLDSLAENRPMDVDLAALA